jgi:streptogramin lyase
MNLLMGMQPKRGCGMKAMGLVLSLLLGQGSPLASAEPEVVLGGVFAEDAIEGPTFWRGNLYASNFHDDGQIGIIDVASGQVRGFFAELPAGIRWNGLAAAAGGIWGLDEAGQRLFWLDPISRELTEVASFSKFKPNDLVVFGEEWLLISAPRWQQPVRGELWALHRPSGQLERLLDVERELNGLALGANNTLYVSNHNQLLRVKLRAEGNRVLVEGLQKSRPVSWCTHMDGVKVSQRAQVIVACYDQGQLAVYDPNNQAWTLIALGLDRGHATNLVLDPNDQSVYVTVRKGWRRGQAVDILRLRRAELAVRSLGCRSAFIRLTRSASFRLRRAYYSRCCCI